MGRLRTVLLETELRPEVDVRVDRVSSALLFFLVPGLGSASMIASATFDNEFCRQTTVHEGELAASASGSCGAESAAARVFFGPGDLFGGTSPVFHLEAAASKVIESGIGRVSGEASFELPILITNTEESGFLRLDIFFGGTIPWASAGSIAQGSYGWVEGETLLPGSPRPRAVYVPFIAGVPFQISASVEAWAGMGDVVRRGDADVTLELYLRVVSRISDSEDDPAVIIPGASFVILPEPPTSRLALTGCCLMLLYLWFGRRLIRTRKP
jgi:hypothetical protein